MKGQYWVAEFSTFKGLVPWAEHYTVRLARLAAEATER